MNRYLTVGLITIITSFFALVPALLAQEQNTKLVVGIVIDQMRFDFMHKYPYSENGFNKLLKEGYEFKNAHFNYIQTETGPGHATVSTGATPSVHGIISNSWFDRDLNRELNCVEDSTVFTVKNNGPQQSTSSSPIHLLSNTISDQLNLTNNFNSKTIGISFKDRAAILSTGHTADAAYWYDGSDGSFVTSTYYMNHLPEWVLQFNNSKHTDRYLSKKWELLKSENQYSMSAADNNPHERVLLGKEQPVFPYDFSEIRKAYRERNAEYRVFLASPFGNTLITDFAIEAIKHEQLGKNEFTDFLMIGYSNTDIIGHTFGPHSREVQDTFMRLDLEIERLISYLDKNIGRDNYIVFLTSDHGAIHNVDYLSQHNMPIGYVDIEKEAESLENHLNVTFDEGNWVSNVDHRKIYLNHSLIEKHSISYKKIIDESVSFLQKVKGIKQVYTSLELREIDSNSEASNRIANGFHSIRSGDLYIDYLPGWIDYSADSIEDIKGTTHGSPHNYDTHVPLLWFGGNIPVGSSTRITSISDIAPTLSMILNIQLPFASNSNPLQEIIK